MQHHHQGSAAGVQADLSTPLGLLLFGGLCTFTGLAYSRACTWLPLATARDASAA